MRTLSSNFRFVGNERNGGARTIKSIPEYFYSVKPTNVRPQDARIHPWLSVFTIYRYSRPIYRDSIAHRTRSTRFVSDEDGETREVRSIFDRYSTTGLFAVLNARSASDRLLRRDSSCSLFGKGKFDDDALPDRTRSFRGDGIRIEVSSTRGTGHLAKLDSARKRAVPMRKIIPTD